MFTSKDVWANDKSKKSFGLSKNYQGGEDNQLEHQMKEMGPFERVFITI